METQNYPQVTPGRYLGAGSSAEVYELDDDRVIKLYHAGVPAVHMENEFAAGVAVNKAGIPSPEYYYEACFNERYGIVCKKITGMDLLREVTKRPWIIFSVGKTFARVHASFHTYKIPGLESYNSQFEHRLKVNAKVLGHRLEKLKAIANQLPDGENIIHGDFNLSNVMRSADGKLVIIDWPNLCKGCFLADVSKTYIGFLNVQIEKHESIFIKVFKPVLARMLARIYLKEYRKIIPFTNAEFENWLVMAAATIIKPYKDSALKITRYLRLLDRKMRRLK